MRGGLGEEDGSNVTSKESPLVSYRWSIPRGQYRVFAFYVFIASNQTHKVSISPLLSTPKEPTTLFIMNKYEIDQQTPPIPPRRKKRKNNLSTSVNSETSREPSLGPRRKPRLPPPPPPPPPPVQKIREKKLTKNSQLRKTENVVENCNSLVEVVNPMNNSKELEFFAKTKNETKNTIVNDTRKAALDDTTKATKNCQECSKQTNIPKNQYPPLLFTFQDFQSVIGETNSQEKKEITASNNLIDDNSKVCFRVTTTNVPFEKCLGTWQQSFNNPEFESYEENLFIFDDYLDRSKRINARPDLFRLESLESNHSDYLPNRSKVRFVIESPSNSTPDDNAEITMDSLQNLESLNRDLEELQKIQTICEEIQHSTNNTQTFDSLLCDNDDFNLMQIDSDSREGEHCFNAIDKVCPNESLVRGNDVLGDFYVKDSLVDKIYGNDSLVGEIDANEASDKIHGNEAIADKIYANDTCSVSGTSKFQTYENCSNSGQFFILDITAEGSSRDEFFKTGRHFSKFETFGSKSVSYEDACDSSFCDLINNGNDRLTKIEEAARDPNAEGTTKDQKTEGAAEDPKAEETKDDVTAETAAEDPKIEKATKDPKAEVKEHPKSKEAEHLKAEEATKDPNAEDAAKDPNAEDATEDRKAEEAKNHPNAKDPKSETTEDSKTEVSTEVPKAEAAKKHTEAKEDPKSKQPKEPPTGNYFQETSESKSTNTDALPKNSDENNPNPISPKETVPMSVRRNSFLDNMLTNNEISCQVIATHRKPNDNSQTIPKKQELHIPSSTKKNSLKKFPTIDEPNKPINEAKCDVLNELLCNFSAIKLKSIANDSSSKIIIDDSNTSANHIKFVDKSARVQKTDDDDYDDNDELRVKNKDCSASDKVTNTSDALPCASLKIASVDKCAIDRRCSKTINNSIDNNAKTPVVLSNDQSAFSITPGSVRNFIKHYEIHRDNSNQCINIKENFNTEEINFNTREDFEKFSKTREFDSKDTTKEQSSESFVHQRRQPISREMDIESTLSLTKHSKREETESNPENTKSLNKSTVEIDAENILSKIHEKWNNFEEKNNFNENEKIEVNKQNTTEEIKKTEIAAENRMENDNNYKSLEMIQNQESKLQISRPRVKIGRRHSCIKSNDSSPTSEFKKSVQFDSACTVYQLQKHEENTKSSSLINGIRSRIKGKAPNKPEIQMPITFTTTLRSDDSTPDVHNESEVESAENTSKPGTGHLVPKSENPRHNQTFVFYCKV